MGAGYRQVMYRNGAWVDVGGGPGSSSSYDDIQDAPIKNIKGSSVENYVSLPGLSYGHYNLTGYYKEDSGGDMQQTTNPIDILVMVDEVTGEKIITYETVNNREIVHHMLVYDGSTLVKHEISRPGDIFWKED